MMWRMIENEKDDGSQEDDLADEFEDDLEDDVN
jgi:hypothetical protein